jgi:hypothetical protein
VTPPTDPSPAAPPGVPGTADPRWFRGPTPREHALAAALFVGFGAFFVALFVVLGGWWFRWVILALGAASALHGLWHAVESRPARTVGHEQPEITPATESHKHAGPE